MTNIPTINELYESILGKYEAECGVSLSPFGKSFIRASARVLAVLMKLVYITLGWVQRNVFVDTCDAETLVRFGMVKIGRPPYPATQGKYNARVTGTVLAIIPANSVWKSDDDSRSPGKLYVLDSAYTITGSDDVILLRALEGGTGSSLAPGDTLTAVQPMGLVDDVALIIDEDITPLNAEDIEVYRKIVISAFRTLAGSWSAVDYRQVGSNILGVQQIYAYPVSGSAGYIDVYIEAVTDVNPMGIPTPTIKGNVETAIEAVRPMGVVEVYYLSVVVKTLDITVAQVETLTAGQRSTIEAALREAIGGVRPYIAAADNLATRLDSLGTDFFLTYCLNLNGVIAGAIPGVAFGAVTFTVNGVPATNVNFDFGNIPYLDSVSYV